jgi:imidazolonepropionase-like amidohydrolase
MTPMEVIAAATKNAAHACNLDCQPGTLEVGMRADVIVVAGDPLQDLRVMENVIIVIKDGKVIIPFQGSE